MRLLILKKKFSILCFVYILANYSFLERMPRIWIWVNSLVRGEGLKLFILIYLILLIFALIYFFQKGIFKSISNIFSLGLFIILFAIMFYFEENPGEKFHLIQYGVFGFILNLALNEFKLGRKEFFLLGFVISFIAGLSDEIIQGILPNRVFTLHDVIINTLSSFAVFLILEKLHLLKKEL